MSVPPQLPPPQQQPQLLLNAGAEAGGSGAAAAADTVAVATAAVDAAAMDVAVLAAAVASTSPPRGSGDGGASADMEVDNEGDAEAVPATATATATTTTTATATTTPAATATTTPTAAAAVPSERSPPPAPAPQPVEPRSDESISPAEGAPAGGREESWGGQYACRGGGRGASRGRGRGGGRHGLQRPPGPTLSGAARRKAGPARRVLPEEPHEVVPAPGRRCVGLLGTGFSLRGGGGAIWGVRFRVRGLCDTIGGGYASNGGARPGSLGFEFQHRDRARVWGFSTALGFGLWALRGSHGSHLGSHGVYACGGGRGGGHVHTLPC